MTLLLFHKTIGVNNFSKICVSVWIKDGGKNKALSKHQPHLDRVSKRHDLPKKISYKRTMQVRVYKFGGASLADIDKVKFVAEYLKSDKLSSPSAMIVVVSAMGKTTDEFIQLAQTVAPHPKRRELDMLLTSGERISMALLSLALNDRGVSAISLTGSQAGIITDSSHGNARIQDTRPVRLEQHLKNGDIVVLAGFQGVSEKEKEITTLGRGGSDTTAVAMAAHFKSSVCDFKKDVGGIYSADPKTISAAQHLPHLNHKHLMDMTFWGSKVLHYRAAELARNLNIPLRLSHFENPQQCSLVNGEKVMIEEQKILSINSHKRVHRIFFAKTPTTLLIQKIFSHYKLKELPYPQLLAVQSTETHTCLLIVGEATDYSAMGAKQSEDLASITITCHNAVASDLLPRVLKCIEGHTIYDILQDSANLTLISSTSDREEILRKLHSLIESPS